MNYRVRIESVLAALGRDDDPGLVEAWMRVEHSTLDWMDPARFADEVALASDCVAEAGLESSRDLARSLGTLEVSR